MTDLGNYEAQAELLAALENNEELATLTKGGFFNLVADKDADFPRVVYSEIENIPTRHADNDESRATVNFQISIFNISETVMYETKMTKIIDDIMKQLKYRKYDSTNLYEEDTEIYHKPLRYEKHFY